MRLIFILCLMIGVNAFSQEDALANDYFKNSQFEKALVEYKKLFTQAPSNINYITQIVAAHQQLEQYDASEIFLLKLIERINYPAFYVELGYNYQLKNDLQKATDNYNKALASLDNNVNHVFSVSRSFESH